MARERTKYLCTWPLHAARNGTGHSAWPFARFSVMFLGLPGFPFTGLTPWEVLENLFIDRFDIYREIPGSG